jgi:ubiquinone/menaquinone biosynthesis C-methylase UbiE
LGTEVKKDFCRILSPEGARGLEAEIYYTSDGTFHSTTSDRDLSTAKRIRNLEQEIDEIRRMLDLNDQSSILEVGTGTGEFAVGIAGHYKKIYAIDVSSEMLEYARRKADLKGIGNIEFHHAGFLTYEHDGEPLDAIVSQLTLHHLPDFWKMIGLKRLAALLRADGKLYLKDVVFPSGIDDYGEFFDTMIETIRKSAGETIASEVENHIRTEYSTLDWIMEDLLKRAGFRLDSAVYYDGFIATYVCSKT